MYLFDFFEIVIISCRRHGRAEKNHHSLALKAAFDFPKQRSKSMKSSPEYIYVPKLDPFQAFTFAKGLCQIVLAKIFEYVNLKGAALRGF